MNNSPRRRAGPGSCGAGGQQQVPSPDAAGRGPEAEAAVVLTDGYIDYPAEPMPYQVLWGILKDEPDKVHFNPPYGIVLPVPVRSL